MSLTQIAAILKDTREELAFDNAVAEEREYLMAKNGWSWDKARKWAIVNVQQGVCNHHHAVVEVAHVYDKGEAWKNATLGNMEPRSIAGKTSNWTGD